MNNTDDVKIKKKKALIAMQMSRENALRSIQMSGRADGVKGEEREADSLRRRLEHEESVRASRRRKIPQIAMMILVIVVMALFVKVFLIG
ncbi:MAG: hypothetical protein KBS85_01530 [Lachnospiraceae bacterium]|nr:hypothetical protein [Candidatus Merdinaster equi]